MLLLAQSIAVVFVHALRYRPKVSDVLSSGSGAGHSWRCNNVIGAGTHICFSVLVFLWHCWVWRRSLVSRGFRHRCWGLTLSHEAFMSGVRSLGRHPDVRGYRSPGVQSELAPSLVLLATWRVDWRTFVKMIMMVGTHPVQIGGSALPPRWHE